MSRLLRGSAPKDAIEKLKMVLSQEQKLGYQDRAVLGGLGGFVHWWVAEARKGPANHQAQQIDRVGALLEGYGQCSQQERQQRVALALQQLARVALGEEQRQEDHPEPVAEMAPSKGVSPVPDQRPTLTPQRKVATRGLAPLETPVTRLWNVGSANAARLERLGVRTIGELLYLLPRYHLDYSVIRPINELTCGGVETVYGTLWEVREERARSGILKTVAVIGDETGVVEAIWFNQRYLSRYLKAGKQVVLSGQMEEYRGRWHFKSPDWELVQGKELLNTARLVPVYPLTEGLYQRWLRRVMKTVVDRWAATVPDHLPEAVREAAGLLALPVAIAQAHFPDSEALRDKAIYRLAFDELFLLQLGVLRKKREWQEEQPGNAMRVDRELVESFIASLPFALTEAQRRVLDESLADMERPRPMTRLLQGDVGSGKTVVATIAMLVAVANGFQSVLMAPTEILAEQHYRTVSDLLERAGVNIAPARADRLMPVPQVRLLIGSLKKSEKEDIHREAAAGENDIVIGTHALIQEGVNFRQLGLAIVDEQHRFGVLQRAALRQKGYNPDLLVMTATPIPRTLALTLYGDLELSVIDQLPPGRQEIKTTVLEEYQRQAAYDFVRHQVQAGHQAFIICPLIEESEKIEARAATAEFERLQEEVFPDLKLGLLHGKMKAHEKDDTMRRFRAGELHILVSTSVVEVGIDVPSATVMLVEGAERFGLAQLHQFRGRVGRGAEKSYCLLLAGSPAGGRERLEAVAHCHDGFALAEEDLRLRGPGEFFGTRQSGLPDLKVARLSDAAILEPVRSAAAELLRRDPRLEAAEHRLLATKVAQFWAGETSRPD